MGMEPESNEPRPPTDMGWRVVVASLLFPLAWVVTGSLTLTILVAGFGFLTLAQHHPTIARLSEESPPLRLLNSIAPVIVLLIFVAVLIRNILR